MAYGVTRIWTSTSTKYTSISLDNSILGANASLRKLNKNTKKMLVSFRRWVFMWKISILKHMYFKVHVFIACQKIDHFSLIFVLFYFRKIFLTSVILSWKYFLTRFNQQFKTNYWFEEEKKQKLLSFSWFRFMDRLFWLQCIRDVFNWYLTSTSQWHKHCT